MYHTHTQETAMTISSSWSSNVVEFAWIQSLDTAYVEDKTFENVVYEEGERYIRGDKSLEEVLGSIETRVGIYLAE